jgi:hypothetical protein
MARAIVGHDRLEAVLLVPQPELAAEVGTAESIEGRGKAGRTMTEGRSGPAGGINRGLHRTLATALVTTSDKICYNIT